MNRWKSFVCILIALWLPLQGYAAVAMPSCQHGDTQGAAQPMGHAQHEDGHAGMQHGATGTDAASDLACTNCGTCQLACAPAITGIHSLSLLIAGTVFEAACSAAPIVFFPELPQRPPLSVLVLSAG
jgi:polyferredoxin